MLTPNYSTFYSELKWRGLIHSSTPDIEKVLSEKMVTAYIGFDPTASSLHIGNLASFMLLKRFQLSGHKPVILIGGATAMIGDPSGKSEERNLQSPETIRYNEQEVRKQLEKLIDFGDKPNAAVVVNNYNWFEPIGFLQFLRDVGKSLTINYMLAKDSVKSRLETGLSFTEFSYQLLQAYDYLHLYKTLGCTLQMGGSDQWGNITSGTELIRRQVGGEAYALTCPLVTRADGTKFGKTATGENIWLDEKRTSPYKFYQFWLNARDEEVGSLIKTFTFITPKQFDELFAEGSNINDAKKYLARELTIFIHGEDNYKLALDASELLFGKATIDNLKNTPIEVLNEVLEGVPQIELTLDQIKSAATIADLLSSDTQNLIFPSKSEARKMLQGGGVSINKTKIDEKFLPINIEPIANAIVLIQKGKKNYFVIRIKK